MVRRETLEQLMANDVGWAAAAPIRQPSAGRTAADAGRAGRMSRPRPLRLALLGCGVVGSAVVRLLDEQSAELAARVGAPLELAGIAVRRPNRHPGVDPALLTTDAARPGDPRRTSTSSSR